MTLPLDICRCPPISLSGESLIVPHHLLGSLFLTHHSRVVGNLSPSQVSNPYLPVSSPCPLEATASLLPPYSAPLPPLVQSVTHLGICQAWQKADLRATSTCTSKGRVCFPVHTSDSEISGGLQTTHFVGSYLHAFADTSLPGMLFSFPKSSHLLCSWGGGYLLQSLPRSPFPLGTPGPGVWSNSPGPGLDLGQLSGISQDSASVSFTFFLIPIYLFLTMSYS